MPNKLILIMDSTQVNAFMECPQMWYYGHYKRLMPAAADSTAKEAMTMGTYGHKLLEILYKYKAQRFSSSAALEAMDRFDPDKETCSCGHLVENHHTNFENGGLRFCTDCGHECSEAERAFPLSLPSRALVKQRCREYTYTYDSRDFNVTDPEKVEIGFSYPLLETCDRIYILEGRIDGLAEMSGQEIWWDNKFQLRRHDLYKKSIQFRDYAMVTGKMYGVINYIRMSKTIDKDTFKRDVTVFSRPELDAWKKELIKIFHTAGDMLADEKFTKNWSSCSGKYGYPCDFTTLCEDGWIPGLSDQKMNQLYKIREEWKPW